MRRILMLPICKRVSRDLAPRSRVENIQSYRAALILCTVNAARNFPMTTGKNAQPDGIDFM